MTDRKLKYAMIVGKDDFFRIKKLGDNETQDKTIAVFYENKDEALVALQALNRRHYLKKVVEITEESGAYEHQAKLADHKHSQFEWELDESDSWQQRACENIQSVMVKYPIGTVFRDISLDVDLLCVDDVRFQPHSEELSVSHYRLREVENIQEQSYCVYSDAPEKWTEEQIDLRIEIGEWIVK